MFSDDLARRVEAALGRGSLLERSESWMMEGRRTDALNWDMVSDTINRMYTLWGLKSPTIIRCQSPLQALLSIAYLQQGTSVFDGDPAFGRRSSESQFELARLLKSAPRLGATLQERHALQYEKVIGELQRQLPRLWHTFANTLAEELLRQDRWLRQVRTILYRDSEPRPRWNLGREVVPVSSFGIARNAEIAPISYAIEEMQFSPGELSEQIDLLIAWTRCAHGMFAFENACLVVERPTFLHLDGQGRLHSDTGPAVGYADGYSIYGWHGVSLQSDQSWIIDHRDRISVEKVDSTLNLEIKRIMLERFGIERYLLDGHAGLIHADEFGRLYQKTLKATAMKITMVQVMNQTPEPDGSVKSYFLEVHPELRPLNGPGELGEPQRLTARNAVASTFGLRGEEFWPLVET